MSITFSPQQLAVLRSKLDEWTDKNGEHWLWTGGLATAGYGRIKLPREAVTATDGRRAWIEAQQVLAHRAAYEVWVGPIPEGLTIDHLCRVRACVKPDHLEPVSMRTNVLRGRGPAAKHAAQTHCKRGHPFTPEHMDMTRFRKTGHRICRTCVLQRHAKRYRTDPEYRAKKIAVSKAWREARRKSA